MKMSSTLVYFFALVAVSHSLTTCQGLTDGNYEISCRTYVNCQNGILTTVQCSENMVYNNKIGDCDYFTNVEPPCGLIKDCTYTADGSYAELSQNCTSYYTCINKHYYGHNMCTSGTVFENTMGICVWPEDAHPPCGTKPRTM